MESGFFCFFLEAGVSEAAFWTCPCKDEHDELTNIGVWYRYSNGNDLNCTRQPDGCVKLS